VSGIQNTFYAIRTHEAWLRAHAALERPEAEAAVYRQRLAAARAGFNAVFFHGESKTYIDKDAVANPKRFGRISMQTSLALALTMGLAESDETASELKRDVIETMGGRMSTGLIGTRYLLQALADAGDVDTALDLLTQRSDPSWGYMLDQGPGTLWEQFLGNASWVRARGSLNHIMLGSQGSFYYERLAGIQMVGNGWAEIRLAPSMTRRLPGFGATLQTVRGSVASSWAWTSRGYQINASVPVTANATLLFRSETAVSIKSYKITEGGISVWDGGVFRAGVPGVLAGRCIGGVGCLELEIIVASGTFAFEANA
jgi:alpha-L-rhamnosidase